MNNRDDNKKSLMSSFEKTGTWGLTVVAGILVMSWCGIKLDEHFETGILFTLLLFFWGFVSAFIFLYLRLKKSGHDK